MIGFIVGKKKKQTFFTQFTSQEELCTQETFKVH